MSSAFPAKAISPVLDALRDRDISVTVCRHEGGAAMMAEAVGKATGRPGICFVTRGPGATNASAGHPYRAAGLDAADRVRRPGRARQPGARCVPGTRLPRRVRRHGQVGGRDRRCRRAWPRSCRARFPPRRSGRPGPVVSACPRHADRARSRARCAAHSSRSRPRRARRHGALESLLSASRAPDRDSRRQPLVRGGLRSDRALRRAIRLPVAPAIGALAAVRSSASLLCRRPRPRPQSQAGRARQGHRSGDRCVGGRLSEFPSQGYTLFDIPVPQTKLVHVHPGAEELGRVYRPHLADPRLARPLSPQRSTRCGHARNAWREQTKPRTPITWPGRDADAAARRRQPRRDHGLAARASLPTDTILCNGAGNYAVWIHRFYRFRRFATHIAPTSASMGYGMPAAVAMKRLLSRTAR